MWGLLPLACGWSPAVMGAMHALPILRDVSHEILGEKTRLMRPEAGGGPIVYQAVVESLPDLRAWPASLPWALQEPSVEESEVYCRMACADFIRRTRLPYLVMDGESGEFLGSVEATLIDWEVPRFEVGFWIRTSSRGKGLMTDALRTFIAYLQESQAARRIECFVDMENMKARSLCERVGMSLEATLHNERRCPFGRLRHTAIYALAD